MSSYYDILCIPEHASEEEIRKAYRKQALLFHPDKNSSMDATARFILILQAYEVLSDKNKRFLYDHQQGEFSQGTYHLTDYNTWLKKRAEEQRAEERREMEAFLEAQKAFRTHRYYTFRKIGIYFTALLGVLIGLLIFLSSLYVIFITHVVVFFVALPFLCAGFLIAYFSWSWFSSKKKLF